MLKLFLPLLTLAFSSASCKKDDDADDGAKAVTAPDSPFFDPSSLAPPASPKSLTPDELKNQILDKRDFFQNQYGSFGLTGDETNEGEGAESACIEGLVAAGRFKVLGSKLIYATAYDLTPCFAQTEGKAEAKDDPKVIDSKVMVYIEYTCEGGDFSSFSGKTLKEMQDQQIECPGSGTMLKNTMSTSKSEITLGDELVLFESSDSDAHSTAANTPCQIVEEGNVDNYSGPCRQVSITQTKFNGETTSSYLMTESQDLKWEDDKEWYNSGTLKTTVNDWTGSVVYAAQEAPTYTFTRGSETVTGTLGVSATLRTMLQSKIMARLKKNKYEIYRQPD